MRILVLAALLAFPSVAQAQLKMQPGQWQFSMNITSFDMPGAPPQVVESIKKQTTTGRCITPAEAEAGPLEMMKNRDHCKITRQSIDGEKFDAVLVCDRPDGTLTQTVNGSVTLTKIAINTAAERTGQKAMKMTTQMTGARVGDCQ
jgi:hypothetical protein